jgi:hypothetical protein
MRLTSRRGSFLLKLLLGIVLTIVVIVASVAGYAYYKAKQLAPPLLAFRDNLQALSNNPAFKKRVAADQDEYQRDGLGYLGRLSAAGMFRLDDSLLVRHAAAVSAMLSAAPERDCAALARRPTLNEVVRHPVFVLTLDPQLSKGIVNDLFLGANAELGKQQPLHVTAEQATQAMAELLRRLPPSQRKRLVSALAPPEAVDPAEVCWAGQTLFGGVARLKEPERSWLARASLPDA